MLLLKKLLQKKSYKSSVFEILFDDIWYIKNYPNESFDRISPLNHYIKNGYSGKFDPNPVFNSNLYIESYLKTIGSTINPLQHYISFGEKLGYLPNLLFNPTWYRNNNPDVLKEEINLLQHFLLYGAAEGRLPSIHFDTKWYFNRYPEVRNNRINPLSHFMIMGHTGKFNPNPFFDASWYLNKYLSQNPEIGKINPLLHYLSSGKVEGNFPNQNMNTKEYEDLLKISSGKISLQEIHRAQRLSHLKQNPLYLDNVNDIAKVLEGLPPLSKPRKATLILPIISSSKYYNDFAGRHENFIDMRFNYQPYFIKKSSYPKPPKIFKFKDMYAVGGSRYLISQENYLLNDEVEYFYDSPEAHLKSDFAIKVGDKSLAIDLELRQSAWIKEGINIMHEYSSNYFHFICETIPRILLAEEALIDKNVPFLIEDDLHKNIYSLFNAVNFSNRPILKLKRKTLYKCKDIYYPSDLTSVIDVYEDCPLKDESTYDIHRISYSIEKIKASIQGSNIDWSNTKRKIFAARRGGQRGLLNQGDIEKEMLKIGFETIYTDNLDLESQIKIFNQSSMVVGPTGAQMANIVWCKPDTKIIVLASKHSAHQLYMWEMLGQVSKSSVKIIQGERSFNRTDLFSVHDDYTIDQSHLLSLIVEMERE